MHGLDEITDILDMMIDRRLVRTQTEFSRSWLGTAHTYLPACRAAERSPTIPVMFRLHVKLTRAGIHDLAAKAYAAAVVELNDDAAR